MWPLGSHVFCTGVLSWSGPDPAPRAWPQCPMIFPLGSTIMTRLSPQPFGQVGSAPAGTPVPATRVNGPMRCASLTPTTECGPATLDPFPNRHTTLWFLGFTSMTRLLYWSEIKTFPGVLNSFPWVWAQIALAATSNAPQAHVFS